jgi:hypothetical protein
LVDPIKKDITYRLELASNLQRPVELISPTISRASRGAGAFIPTLPLLSTVKSVVVEFDVDDAIEKRDVLVSPLYACTESFETGVEVPMPTFPVDDILILSVLFVPKRILLALLLPISKFVEEIRDETAKELTPHTEPVAPAPYILKVRFDAAPRLWRTRFAEPLAPFDVS